MGEFNTGRKSLSAEYDQERMEFSIPASTCWQQCSVEEHAICKLHQLLFCDYELSNILQPEWHSEMLIPWYHYVPLKLDYTDM